MHRILCVLALLLLTACAGPRPSEFRGVVGDGPAVLVKTVRIPDSEPWYSRFADHTFFDLRTRADGPWVRLEVLNGKSGVRVVPLDDGEAFEDTRWTRGVEVLAARTGDKAGATARALLQKGHAQHARYMEGYRAWPGPNSNTFAESLLRSVPGIEARLDHNAVGKDWAWPARAGVSGTNAGVELETPIFGLQVGAVEGVEVHLLGLTLGVGLLPPTLQVPFLPPLPLLARWRVGPD